VRSGEFSVSDQSAGQSDRENDSAPAQTANEPTVDVTEPNAAVVTDLVSDSALDVRI
jgi:hypothetical protein